MRERRPYERNREHRGDFGREGQRDRTRDPVRRRDPDQPIPERPSPERRSPQRRSPERRSGEAAGPDRGEGTRRRTEDDRGRIEEENWRRRPWRRLPD